MKYVVLIGDGMADHPIEKLGGRTPLQAAFKPNMDQIAAKGWTGLARTVPEGFLPGSDVANLSVMGYDPAKYYSGRAPFEAAAMGVHLSKDDIAFRCNFVTVNDGRMVDYSAGHITNGEGRELIESLKPLMPGVRLYSGVGYRNLLILKAGVKAVCTPPHDITGRQISDYMPKGLDSNLLRELMEASRSVLANHPVNLRRIAAGSRPANMIWLWGQGSAPSMPALKERCGLQGAMISAVDLLRGIGVYAGMEVIDVPGATGTIDTNYGGKVEAALNALRHLDFVYLHVEAPDEAGHEGDLELKIRAIELFDKFVVGPLISGLQDSREDWRLLLMPDHATPISLRTHTIEPVPFVLAGRGIQPDSSTRFDEESAKKGGYELVEATELLGIMIRGQSSRKAS